MAGCDYCPNLFFLHLLQTAYFLSLLIKQELWGTSEAVFVPCRSVLTGKPVYVSIKPLVFSVWDHLQERHHVDVQLARVKFFSVWTYQLFIYTTLRLSCLLSCCLQGLLGSLWREAESPTFIGMIYSATWASPNSQIFIESNFHCWNTNSKTSFYHGRCRGPMCVQNNPRLVVNLYLELM